MAQYNPECQPPFLDVANKWTTVGSYPDPSVIEGMSWQQITSVLRRARAYRSTGLLNQPSIVTKSVPPTRF